MPTQPEPNERTPSTTFGWKRVKISQPPEANEHVERSESLKSLLPWPRRRPLVITVKYRGGAECWYEIRSRGRTIRRPGYVQIHDLIHDLAQWPR